MLIFVSMLIMLGLAFWRAIRGKWETSLACVAVALVLLFLINKEFDITDKFMDFISPGRKNFQQLGLI